MSYERIRNRAASKVIATDANNELTALDITGTGEVVLKNNATLSGATITLSADPTNALHAVTKQYVDAVATGLDVKASVRAATTVNIDLSSAPSSIDGVTLSSGDRVLVKNQTTGSENGIYVFNGAASAMTRATDADNSPSGEVTAGMFTFVTEGSISANYGYSLTTPDPITLGTTSLSFSQFSGAGSLTAGDGMTQDGGQFNVVGTADRILVNPDNIDIASTYVGQTSITTLGTITTGVWSGSVISSTVGGTGTTTSTGSGSNVLSASPTLTGTISAEAMTLSSTLSVTGLSTLGSFQIGTHSISTSNSFIGHSSLSHAADLSNTALYQSSVGATRVNAASGQDLVLAIAGSGYVTLTSSAFSITPAVSISSTLAVTGVQTNAADLVFSAATAIIRTDTSDGADSKRIVIGAGGSAGSVSRGAFYYAEGNDYGGTGLGGDIIVASGESGTLYLATGAGQTNRLSIDSSGTSTFSGAVTMASTLATTGLHAATGGIEFGEGSEGTGRIFKSSVNGLKIRGVTGSTNDFGLFAADGTLMLRNPVGTTGLTFNTAVTMASTLTTSGKIQASYGGGAGLASFEASSTSPSFAWNETDAGVDTKNWDLIANAGILSLRTVNDAFSSAVTIWNVTRSAATPLNFGISVATTMSSTLATTGAITAGTSSSNAQNLLVNGYMEISNTGGNSAEIEMTTAGGTGSPKQWRLLSLGSAQGAIGTPGGFAIRNQTDTRTAMLISAEGAFVISSATTGIAFDIDNTSGNHGLKVKSGNNELNDGTEKVLELLSGTSSNPLLTIHAGGLTEVHVQDNLADAFVVKQGSNSYLHVATTNSTELVTIGNSTTNPIVSVIGKGLVIGSTAQLLSDMRASIIGGTGATAGLMLASSNNNITNKEGRLKVGHYTNAEEPVTMVWVASTVSTSVINVGGGSSAENSSTGIDFWTAANNTTLIGTRRGGFASSGAFDVVGNASVGPVFDVYGVGNSAASNYERVRIQHDGSFAYFQVEAGGTGVQEALRFQIGGATRYQMNSSSTIHVFTGSASISSTLAITGATTATGNITVLESAAGTTKEIMVHNTNEASTSADARFRVRVGNADGAGSGDPYIHFGIANQQGFALGIDNSDSDAFVLSRGNILGTNNSIRVLNAGDISLLGAVTMSSTLSVGGNITYTNAGVFNIVPNTSDGADNKGAQLCGGGSPLFTRGGFVAVYGNEHASSPGDVELAAGTVTGGSINFYTADTLRYTLGQDGTHMFNSVIWESVNSNNAIVTGSFLNTNTGTSALSIIEAGTNTTANIRLQYYSSGFTTNSYNIAASGMVTTGADATGGMTMLVQASAPFRVYTAGVERLNIAADGVLATTANVDLQGERIQIGGASNNAVINTRFTMTFNIDSDNNGSSEEFRWASNNNDGTASTNRLMTLTETGELTLAAAAANLTLGELGANPPSPTASNQLKIYMKGDKLVIAYNDAGTVRYKYLDLTGTGVTWVHTTTAP